MRELYYLVSAAVIATMVAAFAVIVIAFILGVVWRVRLGTRRNGGGVVGPAAAGRTNEPAGGAAKTRTVKGPTNRRPKSK